jgi:hypothetical protein
MAYYAFVNDENIVVDVIRGNDETVGGTDWEAYYGEQFGMRCLRTSFNGNYRGIFAGIGYRYDEALNKFVGPAPLPPLSDPA